MMSMRMCSLLSNVQGEHSRKMMLKRTHCSSRYELEEKSKTLRTTALMAETSTTTRMSQDSLRPSQLLNASIFSLMTSSSRTERLPPELYSNPDIVLVVGGFRRARRRVTTFPARIPAVNCSFDD